MYKLFLFLSSFSVFFSASGKCLSDQKQEIDSQKLPVIINRDYRIMGRKNDQISPQALLEYKVLPAEIGDSFRKEEGSSRHKYARQNTNFEPIEIDYTKISSLVGTIKQKLCSTNKGGSYEVWLQIGGETSAIFVNASAQTGIKAVIKCD